MSDTATLLKQGSHNPQHQPNLILPTLHHLPPELKMELVDCIARREWESSTLLKHLSLVSNDFNAATAHVLFKVSMASPFHLSLEVSFLISSRYSRLK